jgi:hypothetical protein
MTQVQAAAIARSVKVEVLESSPNLSFTGSEDKNAHKKTGGALRHRPGTGAFGEIERPTLMA